jgi:uncharacterized protein YcbK (DUF882 family)
MQLTKNFTQKEFNSKDGSTMPNEVLENIKKLTQQLQIIRDYTGKSITINSGYRSPEHNRSIGGAYKIVNGKRKETSQHVFGKAADIVIDGMKPADTYALIEYLNDKGVIKIGGLGHYNTFTHVDIREGKARW